MNKLKRLWISLRDNPGSAFLLALVFGVASSYSYLLFELFDLPQFASVTDNLTQTQVVLGLIISLVSTLISVLAIISKLVFLVSLFYFVFGLVSKKPTSRKK